MKTTPAFSDPIGLIIEPVGPLLFRDGRPFGATDQASTLLQPFPQTLAGMIHSHLMQWFGADTQHSHSLASAAKKEHRAVSLAACRGPWFARWHGKKLQDLYIPAPATLVRKQKENPESLELLQPTENSTLSHWEESYPPPLNMGNVSRTLLPLVCRGKDIELTPEPRWLGKDALRAYLKGECPQKKDLIDLISDSKEIKGLCHRENRSGVTIQASSGTPEAGNLFGVQRVRLETGIAFYAEIGVEDDPMDPDRKKVLEEIGRDDFRENMRKAFAGGVLLPFGGEGGLARVTTSDDLWDWFKAPGQETPAGNENNARKEKAANNEQTNNIPARFFTLLITPALFSTPNAWHPGADCLGVLRAAAAGRPHPVSGWALAYGGDTQNRAGGIPRPLRYAAPAGSVYFWEKGKNNPNPPPVGLIQLTPRPEDRAKGWGLALVGNQWPDPKSE